MDSVSATTTLAAPARPGDDRLMSLARDLESAFLAEMLKSAGLGKLSESFSGGAGEEQFAGFLVDEYAKQTAYAGGIGLSEAIYRALSEGLEASP